MERAEAEAIYEQGRDAVVELLALSAQNERLVAEVGALTARVARQEGRIAQLERKTGRSSRNSSQPPSQDPPGSPPRRGKDPSGRRRARSPAVRAKGRPLLPPWAIDEVVDHWPAECGCGHVFSAGERVAGRRAGAPSGRGAARDGGPRHRALPLIAQRSSPPDGWRRSRGHSDADVPPGLTDRSKLFEPRESTRVG